MVRGTATAMSSMTKAILRKILDDKNIGKKAILRNPTAMDDQMMPTRMVAKMVTGSRTGSMTLGTSKGQTEVDKDLQMARGCKGHLHHLQMETTGDNHPSLKDQTPGTLLLLLRIGQATQLKRRIDVNETPAMAMETAAIIEINQQKDLPRHGLMENHVRHVRHWSRRRVQWTSGKRKRGRGCTKLPTSQRSCNKTTPSPRLPAINQMLIVRAKVREGAKTMHAHRPQVAAKDLEQRPRRTISIECRLRLL